VRFGVTPSGRVLDAAHLRLGTVEGDDGVAVQHPWLSRWSELFIDNLAEYAVFATDLSGTVLTWQPGVRQVLGYGRETFVGKTADIIFTDSDRRAGAPEWEMTTALQLGQATDERWSGPTAAASGARA